MAESLNSSVTLDSAITRLVIAVSTGKRVMNSQSNILVRVANPRDRPLIAQIYKQSIHVICAADYTQEQIQALLEHKQPYKMNIWGDIVFVAEYGERIVGFAALLGSFVSAIFVDPLWIRQGIGTQLLNAIEIEAASRRFKWLFVKASLTGEPFYRTRGYEFIAQSDVVVARGIRFACVDLQKRLTRGSNNPRDAPNIFWEAVQWLLLIFTVIYAIAKLLQ